MDYSNHLRVAYLITVVCFGGSGDKNMPPGWVDSTLPPPNYTLTLVMERPLIVHRLLLSLVMGNNCASYEGCGFWGSALHLLI